MAMGEKSAIEWTVNTFNPWVGCSKVHTGCLHCYAERDFDKRRHFAQWGPNGTRVVTSESNWAKPLKWNRDAEAAGVRTRVFCASLADVFEDWAGPMVSADGTGRAVYRSDAEPFSAETMQDVRNRLFALIDRTPWLDWQLVTKRPENVRKMWPNRFTCEDCGSDQVHEESGTHCHDCGALSSTCYRENVWLLTSVSDQTTADQLIPPLLECRDLVPVLGLSIEPLLGPIVLREEWLWSTRLRWVIVGGESGPGARPMHPQWVRSIRDQCLAAGVPFLMKQWGEWSPYSDVGAPFSGADILGDKMAWVSVDGRWSTERIRPGDFGQETILMSRIGKKAAGRLLDGVTWDQFPEMANNPACQK